MIDPPARAHAGTPQSPGAAEAAGRAAAAGTAGADHPAAHAGEPASFAPAPAAGSGAHHGEAAGPGLWQQLRALGAQLLRFGLVGGAGFIIETVIFNLLTLTVLSSQLLHEGPLIAKALATLVAITTNWIGNRLWTFREHRQADSRREGAEFFAVSLAGLIVGLIPLWVMHYLMGLDSQLWDNAANIIGLLAGSAFRFALYRWWVFAPGRQASVNA